MKNISPLTCILSSMLFSMPIIAEAHPFHWAHQSIGFTSGFFHQLGDIDHIVLLLVIGVSFSKRGIKAQVCLPVVFIMLMLVGAAIPLNLYDINSIQNSEGFVVLALSFSLALGCKVLQYPKIMFVVGMIAIFHGYTHAYDMLLDTDAVFFTLGYISLTAVLILSGLVLKALVNWVIWAVHCFEKDGKAYLVNI